jgi:hypothetical protein
MPDVIAAIVIVMTVIAIAIGNLLNKTNIYGTKF